MAYIEWSKIEKRENTGGNGDGGIFLKFKEGKFRVRCIGQPFFYEQIFIPKKVTGTDRDVPVISPGKDDDPLVRLGYNPSERVAVNVLDRKDGNKLKIMRVGPSVFNHIVSYYEETGVNPCDNKKGPDMLITVEDPGGNPRQRNYTVTFLPPAPLKKDEAKKIKEDGGLHDLEKYFKPTPIKEIEELIKEHGIGSVNGEADFDDQDSDTSAEDGDDDDDEDDDKEFAF